MTEQKKVYIVTWHNFSETHINGVFNTLKKAEEYLAGLEYNHNYKVSEYILDKGDE
jgi:hypothetical protein